MNRLLILLALTACAKPGVTPAPSSDAEANPAAQAARAMPRTEASAGVQDAGLAQLLEDHWAHTMSVSPEWATSLGSTEGLDALSDRSLAAAQRAASARVGFIQRGEALQQAAQLPANDQTVLTLFLEQMAAEQALEACRYEQWSLSPRMNVMGDLLSVMDLHPRTTVEEGQALLRRVQAFDAQVTQQQEAFEAGLAAG